MAKNVTKKIDWTVPLFIVAIVGLFALLITKHYEISRNDFRIFKLASGSAMTIAAARLGVAEPCEDDQELIVFSPTVYLCDHEPDQLMYSEIYRFYPASVDGREQIYSFMSEGNKTRADEMLTNVYDLERYPASTFTDPLTWEEDPYNERYWRFLFYSLRPLRHLIATANETGSERYFQKTRDITESFIDTGTAKVYSWDDAHGVAFRTMMLVNVWWKLRAAGELPGELSDKILATLEDHGDFLLNPDNYEDDYNHAITQSAALLVLAENFPDLENASIWKETAIRRIEISLSSIIDPNGVLIENSPYYHFYVLEKYWEIYEYTQRNGIEMSENFIETIDNMVTFSTYILTPDLTIPLLGASSPRSFVRSGEYAVMAERDEAFDYVLTRGTEGEKPSASSILFPSSGMAILRSGWGTDRAYEDEAHLVFDTGPYRTDHSDFDVLTFSLFSHGTPIIRDSGLFTYEEYHSLYEYFHGTRGHNTIMVDNTSQPTGSGEVQPLKEDGTVRIASANHTLYPGVSHARAIVMLDNDTFIIIDDIESDDEHLYDQLFHLNETAEIETNARGVTGVIENDSSATFFRLEQLLDGYSLQTYKGETDPPRGLCAGSYETYFPCYELSFATQNNTARYITYIETSKTAVPQNSATFNAKENTVRLTRDNQVYELDIDFPDQSVFSSSFIDVRVMRSGEANDGVLRQVKDLLNKLF